MISYIQSSFFYYHYYYFGHTTYHQKLCHLKKPRKMTIRPHAPVEIISFFDIRFLAEILKARKSQQKISLNLQYRFAQKISLILQNSTCSTLKIAKQTQHSQKPFSLQKFSRKHVSGWYQKKHLHCTNFQTPKNCILKAL